MDEKPKPKFQFSLGAALAATLTICVGLGLLRVSPCFSVMFFAFTLGPLIAYITGRDPMVGVFWAVLVLIALAILSMALFPPVRY